MRSIKFRTFIILALIFVIFGLGITISILWGTYKLSPLNREISNEQLILLEKQFNLNDRSKIETLLEVSSIDSKIFKQEINKLDLDILRQDLGRIKFIIQKDVRKTLSTHGQIKLKEKSDLDEGYLLGFFTMRLVADIFSWFDAFFGIYHPRSVDCIQDEFYLRIPYLKFEDSIDVFDIGCAFKGISRLRLYEAPNEENAFIISRSIPIKNSNKEVVGVLSVISDAQIFEQKLGEAFNVILAPVLISIIFAGLFIYYFKSFLTGQANKNWMNAKNIAHNLRNKTSAIKFYLNKNINSLEEARGVIKKIASVNDNLDDFISDTLETAKVEHTGTKVQEKLYNKNNFCSMDSLFNKIKEMYVSENLKFIKDNNCNFIGSENKIFEAFSAALDNALFWHVGNEKIIIESKIGEKKKFVNISVLDRGPGITEKDKKNIFKENFSKSGGTGIGLYKAKLLTIDQGGYINVEDRVGGGATIIFSFRL